MRKLFDGKPYTSSPVSIMKLVKEKKLTQSHFYLYHLLWDKAKWSKIPVRTNAILIKNVLEDLDCTRQHFYNLLKDLTDYNFIKRIYRRGRKRDRFVIIEFKMRGFKEEIDEHGH